MPVANLKMNRRQCRLGGVRESLEKQVMDMAKHAARLLTEKLRHADGTIVECVIADRCIDGIAETALARGDFPHSTGSVIMMDGGFTMQRL